MPSAEGYRTLDRNLEHLMFAEVDAKSISGCPISGLERPGSLKTTHRWIENSDSINRLAGFPLLECILKLDPIGLCGPRLLPVK